MVASWGATLGSSSAVRAGQRLRDRGRVVVQRIEQMAPSSCDIHRTSPCCRARLPAVRSLDIAAHMSTATEVGGDDCDFSMDLEGTLTIVVGDATGRPAGPVPR
jgi:hypothetical protein